MKIKIYSDIACPFCYIGLKRLLSVIEKNFEDKDFQIEHGPFQLNPNLPKIEDSTYIEYLKKSYNIGEDRALQMMKNASDMAKSVGLEWNVLDIKNVNTFDAHRLILFAESKNKGVESSLALMDAYFAKGINIADLDSLISISNNVGLDEEEVRNMLESDDYKSEVSSEIITAKYSGVNSVPFFIFDDYYSVSGAQPEEVFIDVIRDSIKEKE